MAITTNSAGSRLRPGSRVAWFRRRRRPLSRAESFALGLLVASGVLLLQRLVIAAVI